jgi:hypothetical protein
VAKQWGIRQRLGRTARGAQRPLAVLAILAVVAAPVLPQAVAATIASAQPLAVVIAPASGPDQLTGPTVPLDNTADETPGDDSVRQDQASPPMFARAATLDRDRQGAPSPHPAAIRTAVDDAFLAGVYRCNPDGRGPPPRI